MDKYEPKNIEPKWQKVWSENSALYAGQDGSKKPKFYCLDMFPYPSGDGLHVGHVESYTATDIMSRYQRMNGKNVLHPQGWDAFGLPAENYAIKTGVHPAETTAKAIATFKSQMRKMGFSYDWPREQNSSDPEYYRWTQWFFLLLYKNGLAYKKKAKVNWCESCQTVLANEQAEGGICDRCQQEVVQKDLEQWFFKITDFIETNKKTTGLIEGLEKVDWPESIKAAQKNWIGKSEGATIKFQIVIPSKAEGSKQLDSSTTLRSAQNDNIFLEVFTTRVDTIFGCTYCVLAPEHKLVQELKSQIENWAEVEKYLIAAQNKTELERMETKEKTGVEMQGVKLINPFNQEKIPLFVGDYVLAHYGTGAVMSVPAHDERDWDFARKYNLPIKEVVLPKGKEIIGSGALIETPEGKFIFQKRDHNTNRNPGKIAPFGGGIKDSESFEDCLIREMQEEIELDVEIDKIFVVGKIESHNLPGKFINIFYIPKTSTDKLKVNEGQGLVEISLEEALKNEEVTPYTKNVIKYYQSKNNFSFTEDGILTNSKKYDGLTSESAREKMTEWLEKEGIGAKKINYKLRDWLVSRQRYWGAPIPIIYCEKCGEVAVPEKDLPVLLPTDVDFKPTGESPLAYSKTFQDVKCPQCGGAARRESDTMDTFVCSSWYYFRYADPRNGKEFAAKDKLKYWLPVDLYVGGAEHAVLHLLYARFFTKVLHNLGQINFDEPFLKLRNQGLILAEDGRKMSKSLGNVVNPDQVVAEFGADSLRMFEMFMGPLEDAKPWNTRGIVGIKRFLEKIWKLQSRISEQETENKKIKSLLHKTIKKVSEDIENLRFNTAISAMMILVNEMEKEEKIRVANYELLIIILSPFAPHIAEELWNELGRTESIFKESWPEYDPALIKDEKIKLVVQVNGKVRDTIEVDADISEDAAKKLATQSEKAQKFIAGQEIKKIIFVKGKLINIVVA